MSPPLTGPLYCCPYCERRSPINAAIAGKDRMASMKAFFEGVGEGHTAGIHLDVPADRADFKARYAARRAVLLPAVRAAGFVVEHSEAGLYLWCTRDEACWDTVAALADVGLLAAPGAFYGEAGARHVRLALTATDERIDAAAERLAQLA